MRPVGPAPISRISLPTASCRQLNQVRKTGQRTLHLAIKLVQSVDGTRSRLKESSLEIGQVVDLEALGVMEGGKVCESTVPDMAELACNSTNKRIDAYIETP